MFKHAYVRGIQNALIQGGHVAFPDADSAIKVADYIADRMAFDVLEGPVPRETTAKVAEHLIDASNYLAEQPGFKAASFQKLASVEDLGALAHQHALHLMEKAAEGSTIEGGDKGNAEASTAEGKMDENARPAGYAENSRGTSEIDTRPGAVGDESPNPAGPTNSPMGSNSIEEQSRTASLGHLIAKLAEGSTILGGDKGNNTPATAEGKMDAAARPAGYAVLPSQGAQGAIAPLATGPAIVGREIPQPTQPGQSASGTNSVIEHSQKAAEDAYITLFKKTASEVVPHLPTGLNDNAKVAHVRACMGLSMEEKAAYLHGLQKEAADRTAQTAPATRQKRAEGGLPPFIQEKIDAKKDEGGEKKDEEKKDESGEKKDEEKKEDEKSASLRDLVRRISSAVQA